MIQYARSRVYTNVYEITNDYRSFWDGRDRPDLNWHPVPVRNLRQEKAVENVFDPFDTTATPSPGTLRVSGGGYNKNISRHAFRNDF